jgi:Zinc knuckle
MQENQRILKYNVDFNRLAIQTGWDDGVLRHRYYSGLAERIKDIMGQQGKPSTLDAMKLLAHSIDARYWERHREKSRSDKSKSDKPDKPDNKPDNPPKSDKKGDKPKKGKTDSDSGKQSSASGSSSHSEKLGKDGKLTSQERQRRFDNNLCMFCGGVGHVAKDCPKSTSSASKAKGRAVQAKEKEEESPDSKKE